MGKYIKSAELEQFGGEVLAKYHANKACVTIAFLYRPVAPVVAGRVYAGVCVHCSDRDWHLHRTDFVIEIGRDVWDEASPAFREAIMDHELSHIQIYRDGNGVAMLDPKTGRVRSRVQMHDVEEFAAVLERHGAYHKDLRDFLAKHYDKLEARRKARGIKPAAPVPVQATTSLPDPPPVADITLLPEDE